MSQKVIFLSCFLFFFKISFCQSIEIGSSIDYDQRIYQLLSNNDTLRSFTIRPTFSDSNVNKHFWSKFLPVSVIHQYNLNHPYGINNSSMISSKGYQIFASTGFFTSIGNLQFQLKPQFVYAANPIFQSNNYFGSGSIENKKYSKFFPGQSFVKFKWNSISFGVSTENLWWGPGQSSALMMSNNAPGFLHFTIATNKPLKTKIGSFEFQLIAGKLTSNSNELSYENKQMTRTLVGDRWRYLNSFILTWRPFRNEGLFLGIVRSLQFYGDDFKKIKTNVFNKFMPIINLPIQKSKNSGDDSLNRDQLASFFLRWYFPKSNFEFYLEYGKNDYGINLRDYLLAPTHSYAYLMGFKKIIKFHDKNLLDVNFEIVQMAQSPDHLVREAGSWYTHWQVKQGFTNHNQILGAGTGYGNNLQTLNLNLINDKSRFGLLFERIERDPTLREFKWTDLSLGIIPQWTLKNLELRAKFQLISSSNFMWEQRRKNTNLHLNFNLLYFLK